MKAFFITFISISFNLIAFSQTEKKCNDDYSDLNEFGLNGKVKTIETSIFAFDNTKEIKENIETMNSSNWFNKTIVYYNKNGNIDSLYVNYLNPKDSKQIEKLQINYSYNRNIRNGITLEKKNNLTSKTLKNWIKRDTYDESTYSKEGTLLKVETTVLNHCYQISARNIKIVDHRLSSGKHLKYIFDDHNHLTKVTVNYENNNETEDLSKIYIAFDNLNNPVTVINVFEKKGFINKDISFIKYTYY